MPRTPEAMKKACDALLHAMEELDSFEDRADLASQGTRGTFEETYERFVELAVAKGFLRNPTVSQSPSSTPTHAGSRSQETQEEEEQEQDDEEFLSSLNLQEAAPKPKKTQAVGADSLTFFFLIKLNFIQEKLQVSEPQPPQWFFN
jgi:hypothetical protein